jgi:hypothetical protein
MICILGSESYILHLCPKLCNFRNLHPLSFRATQQRRVKLLLATKAILEVSLAAQQRDIGFLPSAITFLS